MTTAIATARAGMLVSIARLNASASNIANGATAEPLPRARAAQPLADGPEGASRVHQPTPNVDLVEEAVGLLEASLLFKANLAVLKTADQMMRRTLDIAA